MDRNEFWALTGCSMSILEKEDVSEAIKRKEFEGAQPIINKKEFSVVLVERDKGRSFREFEFLKSFDR